jgi:uncharacterized protein (TIGR00369 family)
MTLEEPDVPSGFERHSRRSAATAAWEPLWSRRNARGLTIGFRVTEAHCNARGFLHGGVVSTLADNAMGLSCAEAGPPGGGLVTVSLSVDFLASGAIGDWVTIDAEPDRVGTTIAHANARVSSNGELIGRASAVFRVISPAGGQ